MVSQPIYSSLLDSKGEKRKEKAPQSTGEYYDKAKLLLTFG